MCKKLIYVISFMLILSLAGNALAGEFTDADPNDSKWSSALNWDPNTAVPDYTSVNWVNGPLTLECDVPDGGGTPFNISNGAVVNVVSGGVLNINTTSYAGHAGTATVNVKSGGTAGSAGGFIWCFAWNYTGILNVEPGGTLEGCHLFLSRGTGTSVVNCNTDSAGSGLRQILIPWTGQPGHATFNMNGGLIKSVAGSGWKLEIGATTTGTGILNLNGGLIQRNVDDFILGTNGTINVNGGTLEVGGDITTTLNAAAAAGQILSNGTAIISYDAGADVTTLSSVPYLFNEDPANFGFAFIGEDTLAWDVVYPLFQEDFAGFTGTLVAGAQGGTGLDLAHSGSVTGWSKAGSGTMHAVDLGSSDWAIMFWADNVITSSGVVANDSGQSYELTFDYGTASWSGTDGTRAGDGLLVEILRADDTVLASNTFLPGAWGPGNYNLDAGLQGSVSYTGDGSGDVRIRIGSLNAGAFNGSIDNLLLEQVSQTATYDVVFGEDPNMADLVANTLYSDVTSPLTVPAFTAEKQYYWQVQVSDPDVNSPVFTFSTANQVPVANPGPDTNPWVAMGNRPLNASASWDPDSQPSPLTYVWTLVSETNGASGGSITNPTATVTTLVMGTPGTYVVELAAYDGEDTGTAQKTINLWPDACQAGAAGDPEFAFDRGDINQDCVVNEEDMEIQLGGWLDHNGIDYFNPPNTP